MKLTFCSVSGHRHHPAMEAASTNIQIGAENMYFEEKGAVYRRNFPNMLVDGRRKNMSSLAILREESTAETNETVNKKVLKAFEHGITPIICVW